MRCLLYFVVAKVSKLEELGVETAALSVDCLNPVTSVIQVSSKNAAAFLEETDTANKFALKMSGNIYYKIMFFVSCPYISIVFTINSKLSSFHCVFHHAAAAAWVSVRYCLKHVLSLRSTGLIQPVFKLILKSTCSVYICLASCSSPSPVESVHDLVKKVQDLFNQKYSKLSFLQKQ